MSLIERLRKARLSERQAPVSVPESSGAPWVRRRFYFSGVVQGVGFRYEAQRTAYQLELTGWARNQEDGSVVVELEGPANCIEAFLMTMESVPRFDITDIRREDLAPTRSEKSFRIEYY